MYICVVYILCPAVIVHTAHPHIVVYSHVLPCAYILLPLYLPFGFIRRTLLEHFHLYLFIIFSFFQAVIQIHFPVMNARVPSWNLEWKLSLVSCLICSVPGSTLSFTALAHNLQLQRPDIATRLIQISSSVIYRGHLLQMNVIILGYFCSRASSLPRCPPRCPSRRACPRCPRWSPAGCPPLPGRSGRVWRSGRSRTRRNAASWNVAHSAARRTETSHWTLGLRSFCGPERETEFTVSLFCT